jgi:hypothetical protein
MRLQQPNHFKPAITAGFKKAIKEAEYRKGVRFHRRFPSHRSDEAVPKNGPSSCSGTQGVGCGVCGIEEDVAD